MNWERNQVPLKRNAGGFSDGARGTTPREGIGLLQGRVICGVCGKHMRVAYQKVTNALEPYYVCRDAVAHEAGKACQSIRGRAVDAAITMPGSWKQ